MSRDSLFGASWLLLGYHLMYPTPSHGIAQFVMGAAYPAVDLSGKPEHDPVSNGVLTRPADAPGRRRYLF